MNRDQKYWKTIIPEISKYTTVFTYDPLGIGGSDKGEYPSVADKEIKDLKTLLEKREIPEPRALPIFADGDQPVPVRADSEAVDLLVALLQDMSPR